METVEFPFGTRKLSLELPDNADVILPVKTPGVADELAAVRQALQHPIGSDRLRDMAPGKTSVVIVINDITRPTPTETILTALMEELSAGGVLPEQVTLLIALGNHEMPTNKEIKKMTGIWYKKLNTICHDCYNKELLSFVGKTKRGMPVYVNKYYTEASLRILTGIITPHQSAGFSGGRKSVVPGIAGIETLKTHHSFPIRPHEPVMGIIKDNSFHEEAVAAARLAGVDFIVNVIKNYNNEIVDVVAGDMEKAHLHGVEVCKNAWVRKVDKPYDVVFVSPGGYPKDIDLHQAQKAVAVAEQVTKPGGVIVLVAECSKGIGKFANILKMADSVDTVIKDFIEKGFSADHSSKAYMFARALKKHKLMVVTGGIAENELSKMFMQGFSSLTEAAAAALSINEAPSILCIPYSGECIPVVSDQLI